MNVPDIYKNMSLYNLLIRHILRTILFLTRMTKMLAVLKTYWFLFTSLASLLDALHVSSSKVSSQAGSIQVVGIHHVLITFLMQFIHSFFFFYFFSFVGFKNEQLGIIIKKLQSWIILQLESSIHSEVLGKE